MAGFVINDSITGEDIKRIRVLLEMTQKEFAQQVSRSEAEVCRWVGGTHNFTLATLAKISAALGVPLITV